MIAAGRNTGRSMITEDMIVEWMRKDGVQADTE